MTISVSTQRVSSGNPKPILYICPRPPVGMFPDTGCDKVIASALGVADTELHTVHPARGDRLPEDLDGFKAAVFGGSELSVNSELEFRKSLEKAIDYLLKNNVPLLGICFGLQFISQYLGGKVEEGMHGWESGIADIYLTDEGQRDVLFKGVNHTFQAPTSHKEVVTKLPGGAIELAYNDMYRFQALRFQDNAWGVQFHPEMTREFIASHVMAHDSSNTQELERIQTADLSDVQKLTLNLL